MKAMLVIATQNGYAALPFDGAIPTSSIADLHIATSIREPSSYSYRRGPSIDELLEDYFEPEEAPESVPLKVA